MIKVDIDNVYLTAIPTSFLVSDLLIYVFKGMREKRSWWTDVIDILVCTLLQAMIILTCLFVFSRFVYTLHDKGLFLLSGGVLLGCLATQFLRKYPQSMNRFIEQTKITDFYRKNSEDKEKTVAKIKENDENE